MAGLVAAVDDLPQFILGEARSAPLCCGGGDRPESPGLHRFLEREDCQRQGAAVAPDPGKEVGIAEQARGVGRRHRGADLCFAFVRRRFAAIMDHPFPKGTHRRARRRAQPRRRVTRELTSGRARPSIRTDTRLDAPDAWQAAARTRGEVLCVDAITQRRLPNRASNSPRVARPPGLPPPSLHDPPGCQITGKRAGPMK